MNTNNVELADPRIARLPSSTYVLCLCQALNLTAAVVSVTVAALAGERMAPGPGWATLPYGVQFAVLALLTYPASVFMQCLGRKVGFLCGAAVLIVAGCIGFLAVQRSSFIGLIVAHGLLGAYASFANFYRFAAVDHLPNDLRPRGVSLVVAGGVLAAFLGPWISIGFGNIPGYAPLSLCYASFVGIGLATIALLGFWRPKHSSPESSAVVQVNAKQRMSPALVTAIFAAAIAYMIMNLLMVQASLVMDSLRIGFHASTWAIQGHVLAMFLPSFFTGLVIARFGYCFTLCGGFLLLICTTLLALIGGEDFYMMIFSLVFLGVGWNLSYIGGGALLAKYSTEENRHRIQGINDSTIAICATVGAFAPAPLQTLIGWKNTNLICFVICVFGLIIAWYTTRKTRLV